VSHDDRFGGPAEPVGPEEMDFGSSHSGRRIGAPTIAAGLVALLVVAVIARHGHSAAPPRQPARTPVVAAPIEPERAPPRGPARAAPLVSPGVRAQLLGVKAGWNLFARAPGLVVRFEFARGIVTRTAVPTLRSTGPVSFVVGPQGAVIRPLDVVPGYLVPDGHFARQLPVALRHGGPALPGPKPGQIWVQTTIGTHLTMALLSRSGRKTGVSMRLPRGIAPYASDGNGYLLVTRKTGIYDARPTALRRITSGQLLAVGPNHWLTRQCDATGDCTTTIIDQFSAGQVRFDDNDRDHNEPTGVISPNGEIAALPITASDGAVTLLVVDLVTGVENHLSTHLSPQGAFDSEVAWSPDSKWLFAASARGALLAVNARTGHTRRLRIAPPQISQLVVRPTQS
jgi:hypothetical protein